MTAIYFIVTIGAGLFLYQARGLHPFWYGTGEIVVAVAMIYLWFSPPESFLLADEMSAWGLALSRSVGLVLGIYLLVRGMDNVDRGLPRAWRRWWDRLFPKHHA